MSSDAHDLEQTIMERLARLPVVLEIIPSEESESGWYEWRCTEGSGQAPDFPSALEAALRCVLGKKRTIKQKRRGKGEGTVFQRKDGRWVSEITLEDGKRKPLYGKTQEEAIAKRQEALYQQRQGTLATGPRKKLGDHIDWWLEEVKKLRLEESSYIRYRGVLDVHILPNLGHIQLQKLTLQKIQTFYNEKLKGELSSNTVHQMHGILHGALAYAVKARLISHNPCDGVSLPPPEKRKVQPLTLEQVQHLLKTAHESSPYSPLEVFVALALTTGMRHGEIISLRWEDIDFEEGSIYVHRNVGYLKLEKYQYIEGDPKTDAGRRTIPLAPAVSDLLKTHRVRQNEIRLKAGSHWEDHDLVFCNRRGHFFNPTYLRTCFYQLLERAKLPRMHIHDLRHEASDLFRSMGIDIKVIQEILGHSSADITANVYSQILPHMRKDASEKINRLFQ